MSLWLRLWYFPLKCLWHLKRKCSLFRQKRRVFFSEFRRPVPGIRLNVLFPAYSCAGAGAAPVWEQYRAGRFDLLGTGWISRRITQDFLRDQRGCHREYSRKLREMISPDYQLLDWQKDPRSGKSGTVSQFWADNTALSGKGGFDIKQPWELGRMQYLSEVAAGHVQRRFPEQDLWRFFKDSVLDFYASNPYGMGCQWGCSMDVAIRAVNVLVAYTLFRTSGAGKGDPEFDAVFARFIQLHGRHIRRNLEKQLYFANNHYFADLCGLIFIGAALRETAEGRRWFRFAVKEFRSELVKQFLPDGGNFEASSTYHVQVGEMAVFTLALLIGEGEVETWPEHEQQNAMRLVAGMVELAQTLIAPDGNLVQIGDNDSGIFLHLAPVREVQGGIIRENRRNIAGFVAAATALSAPAEETTVHPDALLIHALLHGRSVPFASKNAGHRSRKMDSVAELPELPFSMEETFQIPVLPPEMFELEYFSDFGVAVWKAPGVWLSLFWGGPGQCGVGGHSHNDKLSMILFVDGKAVLNDPGSFCYTGDPVRRNLYRSVHSHPFAVSVANSREEEFAGCSLFSFPVSFSVTLQKLSTDGIQIQLKSHGCCYKRTVQILPGIIRITTACSREFDMTKDFIPFSDAYGHTEDIA